MTRAWVLLPPQLSLDSVSTVHLRDEDAHVEIKAFFSDREPPGPYRLRIPARHTLHVRFNELEDPEPIPPDTDDAGVVGSDPAIVVQHTRLDPRQAESALVSTIAYTSND